MYGNIEFATISTRSRAPEVDGRLQGGSLGFYVELSVGAPVLMVLFCHPDTHYSCIRVSVNDRWIGKVSYVAMDYH
jgi:hypothetical protein